MNTSEIKEKQESLYIPISPIVQWAPNDIIQDCFERDEAGDAELLCYLFKGKIAYDHSERQWYMYQEHSWISDRTGKIWHLVTNNVASQYLHWAGALQSLGVAEEKVKEAYKRSRHLRFSGRVERILKFASMQPGVALTGDEWHKEPLLLATPTGVLDLTDGYKFRPGKPEDYLRIVIPTEWKGLEEPAPRWEQFLTEIFPQGREKIGFVQRLLGYGLTGLSSEDKFPIFWGEGRNGKDTLLETIEFVLGHDTATPVQSEVIVHNDRNPNAATPTLMAIRDRRIVWVSETNEGTRLNGGQVKLLTGGGSIAARPLYGKMVVFKPTHLIILMTNHKPHPGDDDAVWKRLMLIEFSERFLDDPKAPNEHKKDSFLSQKLQSEASGILAWLVKGALEFRRNGLNPPPEVIEATDTYRIKEDMIEQWMADECEIKDGVKEKGNLLYTSYTRWSEGSGLKPMTANAFGQRLERRFAKKRTMHGVFYEGICLVGD